MKLPLPIAEKLMLLHNGEKLPFSRLKHPTVEAMIDNGILKKQIKGRTRVHIYLHNRASLFDYLRNHFGIESLETYIKVAKKETVTRGESIQISSNSKLRSVRTFKGFLVNSYEPVECILKEKSITIQPTEGTFTFIYDFETFVPNPGITIVGIENPENFRYIRQQRTLFRDIHPLFISRYPFSKDLVKWLTSIQNDYLHFGDFDFAGLNIYLNEYKIHLKKRASFFLPNDIEPLLSSRGNRKNYENQKIQFEVKSISEENVVKLIALLHKHKKGLEQEIFASFHAKSENSLPLP